MTSLELDHYYVEQPNYWHLKLVANLLQEHKATEALAYITEHQLPVNSYVKLSPGVYVPLIYRASLSKELYPVFKWLWEHGAKPELLPDVATDTQNRADHLLLVCCPALIVLLVRSGLKLDLNQYGHSICTKIRNGNLTRIKQLIRAQVLTSDQLQQTIDKYGRDQLALDSLTTMIDQLKAQGQLDRATTESVKLLRNNYLTIIRTINPDPFSQPDSDQPCLLQFCADYYLYNIIQLFMNRVTPAGLAQHSIVVPYHGDQDQLDRKLVAALRYIYNDYGYVATCNLLKQPPCKEAF